MYSEISVEFSLLPECYDLAVIFLRNCSVLLTVELWLRMYSYGEKWVDFFIALFLSHGDA